MKLPRADCKLVSLGKLERKHAKVLHQRRTVDADFQIADELIEREVDLMLLLDSDAKAELHLKSPMGTGLGSAKRNESRPNVALVVFDFMLDQKVDELFLECNSTVMRFLIADVL